MAPARVAGASSEAVSLAAERPWLGELWEPRHRHVAGMAVALAVLQQWTGVQAIFHYVEEIYRRAGDVSDMRFHLLISVAINLGFTGIAMTTLDRVGRRRLMLIGSALVVSSHALLGLAYPVGMNGSVGLGLTLLTIGCFATTLLPVVWVLMAEVYPNRAHGAAVSWAVSAVWVACLILTYTFPLMNRRLGPAGIFWLNAAICFAGIGFVWARAAETKGKSLERIEHEL